MGRARVHAAALVVLGACAPPSDPPPRAAEALQKAGAWSLERGEARPEGADGAPRQTLTWRGRDTRGVVVQGTDPAAEGAPTSPSGDTPRPLDVRAVFPHGDGLLALDLEDRLLALHPDGEVEVLTAPVVVAPLLSPDGARLAVAVGDAEGPSQLRILGPGDLDRVVASAVHVSALVRFTPEGDGLVFVGRSEAGIAGLREVALDAHGEPAAPRCLTNCALGPEGARDPSFVPLPAEGEGWAW